MSSRAALFDLGNVVVHVDTGRSLARWSTHSSLSPQLLRERFCADAPYRAHETGALHCDAYFAHLRERLALDADLALVRDGWNAMLVAEIADTVALLDRLRAVLPCHALSNTNATHITEIGRAFPALLPRFERVFVSHEIGHRKPDRAAFEHVLHALGLPAAEVLFFDDLPENVQAAAALGIDAVLVRGPRDVRDAVLQRGLLAA